MRVGGRVFFNKWLVMRDASYVLLGAEFMSMHSALIDYKERTVALEQDTACSVCDELGKMCEKEEIFSDGEETRAGPRAERDGKSGGLGVPDSGILGVFAVLQPLLGLNESNYEKRLLERVEELVTRHSSAFALHDTDRGVVSKVLHKIRLKDPEVVVRQVPRREPFAIRPFLQAEVRRLLAQGIIRLSFSPFASGVVCVPKPDSPNSIRLCVDYRELNANTVDDGYPLPRIGDLLDRLQGAKFFSALDMQWGYLQIPVEEADKFKTAFVVQSGHYEYNFMPFGLKTAPATYQRLMERILSRLSKPCAFAYLDDVVVFSKTEEEHFQILEELFAIFEEYGLKLKPSKCQILRESVAILGVVVTRDGVSTNPKKIASVTNWGEPKNATDLLSFLGFCNFYRWFVSD
jgi:hypothetical protein